MEKHLIRERAWPMVYRVDFYFRLSVKRKRLCFDLSLSQKLPNCNKCFSVILLQEGRKQRDYSQTDFFKYLILVILINSKIPFCDLIGRMIIDIHQHGRGHTLLPGVIAKGLAKGVAADMLWQACIDGSFFDYAVGLVAA